MLYAFRSSDVLEYKRGRTMRMALYVRSSCVMAPLPCRQFLHYLSPLSAPVFTFADRSSEESLVQLTGSVDPADNLRWSIQVYKAVKDTNTGGSSAEKDGETYSQGIMEELKSKDRWVSRAILYKRFHESSTI
ncbi:uncharacterized protein LOC116189280 isoform X3 [Punica granatum]|uniref:Uncharacterized protein LOC116189280 isoform X3 n=1 Tax=Punica granatum TaxID=22663 RepID=A0A6P8BWN2_PUNGR|nr:uncharacterized protein LOC116189280 isoform X3 [Punica granatum]